MLCDGMLAELSSRVFNCRENASAMIAPLVVMVTNARSEDHAAPRKSRREELFAFVILAVLIWPVLAVGVVGGYGFLVWMFQLVFGPPGPPH